MDRRNRLGGTARTAIVVVTLLLLSACAAGATAGDEADDTTGAPAAEPTTAVGAGTTPVSTAAPTTVAVPTTTTSTTVPAPTTTTTTTTPYQEGAPTGLALEVGDLTSGSKGLRTFALQKALKGLKFDPGEPDGAFGLKTTMAVWAYQALRGLPSDGVVRPLLEADILTAAPPAMLRPDLGPTHSEVDLDKQVLLVFRDGVLQLVTHVSTGSGRAYCENGNCGDALTPPGEFAYQRRIAGWRVAPLGRLYNPVYFNGGIAVHGAPSVPDRPASHGCVRIPMHIAEYFPSLVQNGEPISVFRGGLAVAAAVAPPPADAPAPPADDLLAGA